MLEIAGGFAVHNKAPCPILRGEAKRDDGIRNGGPRYIAGLPPADDAFAAPPRKSERPRDGSLPEAAILPPPTAGAPSVGSAAITPHSTGLTIRAIQRQAVAAEALTG